MTPDEPTAAKPTRRSRRAAAAAATAAVAPTVSASGAGSEAEAENDAGAGPRARGRGKAKRASLRDRENSASDSDASSESAADDGADDGADDDADGDGADKEPGVKQSIHKLRTFVIRSMDKHSRVGYPLLWTFKDTSRGGGLNSIVVNEESGPVTTIRLRTLANTVFVNSLTYLSGKLNLALDEVVVKALEGTGIDLLGSTMKIKMWNRRKLIAGAMVLVNTRKRNPPKRRRMRTDNTLLSDLTAMMRGGMAGSPGAGAIRSDGIRLPGARQTLPATSSSFSASASPSLVATMTRMEKLHDEDVSTRESLEVLCAEFYAQAHQLLQSAASTQAAVGSQIRELEETYEPGAASSSANKTQMKVWRSRALEIADLIKESPHAREFELPSWCKDSL